ncbi:MAG: bactofilin family protein [Thermomicrobiales bacterium]
MDSFQRQMSALRQQLGNEGAKEAEPYQDQSATPADAGGFNFGDFGSAGAATETDIASEAEAPLVPDVPVVTDQTSVVAHDTAWKGEFDSEGSVHIHGRVEGSVRAKQDVFIAEEADVDATVTATNVIVAGLVKGTIRCTSRFEVLPQGRVSGDFHAPTLVVHEGAFVTGQFRMGASEQSTEAKPTSVVQRRAARGSA